MNETSHKKALELVTALMIEDPYPETRDGKILKTLANWVEEHEIYFSRPEDPTQFHGEDGDGYCGLCHDAEGEDRCAYCKANEG